MQSAVGEWSDKQPFIETVNKNRTFGGKMKIGDLVKDVILGQLGIIIKLEWLDDADEVVALVQLSDNTTVLCSYEDMELVACNL